MNADRRPRKSPLALALAALFSCSDAPSVLAATYVVNTSGDPGPGGTLSLRQAISSANASAGNVVQFDPGMVGSTITLAAGELGISNAMTIIGPGAGKLTISGNHASGVFLVSPCPHRSSNVYISGLTLTNGHTPSIGGAISLLDCTLHLDDMRVTGSQALEGGGIFVDTATVFVQRSTISGNSADSGGGMHVGFQGYAGVAHSAISGNTAVYAGAGLYAFDASLHVSYSTISGNSIAAPPGSMQTQGGAGVFSFNSKFTCAASTIANNYAYAGGAGVTLADAYAGAHALITFSTIAGNNSCCYESGNGITSAGGLPLLFSTIVGNNFNRGGGDDLAGSFNVYYSLLRSPAAAVIANGGPGTIIGVDPKLGALGDNGGPTRTMLPAADSPAVDAFQNCLSTYGTPNDQRGLPVCVNEKADIGAVERQSAEVVIFRNGFEST